MHLLCEKHGKHAVGSSLSGKLVHSALEVGEQDSAEMGKNSAANKDFIAN